MAAASRHLCRSLPQVTRSIPAKRKCLQPWRTPTPLKSRAFATTTRWRTNDRNEDQSPISKSEAPSPSDASTSQLTSDAVSTTFTKSPDAAPSREAQLDGLNNDAERVDHDLPDFDISALKVPSKPVTVADLDPLARADYEALPRNQQEKWLARENHFAALLENNELDNDESIQRHVNLVSREISRDFPMPSMAMARKDIGYWAEDEEDEFDQSEDADDDVDDSHISTVAESELEVHREVREYMRIAAWDMPLLRKFAKEFKQPRLDQPLRFRYTTYMGESHPAQRKVVVEFCIKDLPGLSQQHQDKLIKLVGVRYNPDTDVVRMSCEKFAEAAQNKRYLGDLVAKLVTQAQDETDTLADIPFDFRHHKSKKRPQFPEEWKLSPGRVQQLLEARSKVQLLDSGRGIVDGAKLVEEYITLLPTTRGTLRS